VHQFDEKLSRKSAKVNDSSMSNNCIISPLILETSYKLQQFTHKKGGKYEKMEKYEKIGEGGGDQLRLLFRPYGNTSSLINAIFFF